MRSCLLQARCLSAWQGGTAWPESLLPVPSLPRPPPGEQGQEDQLSCGHVFFGRAKLGWEMGSERSEGLEKARVLLERCMWQHHSQQITWASPLVSKLWGLSISFCPCFAISAQWWDCSRFSFPFTWAAIVKRWGELKKEIGLCLLISKRMP